MYANVREVFVSERQLGLNAVLDMSDYIPMTIYIIVYVVSS